MDRSRSVRIFLSSTFRDFGEERDLLVKRVFPALRARLKDRFVELVDVDLRWGITVEEAERGEVLPICLAEIDRSRPYFIGMLGERYGWIPPPDGYAADLLERQPWLKKHQGGKSVTELEILHGVLNNRRMQGRAFFYFRSPRYSRTKGGDYLPSFEDRTRQTELKRRIRERGLPVTAYANPEALAKRIERDLWKLLDAEFPASEVPDAYERERLRHEAYAAPRRRLYLGGERYQTALNKLLDTEEPRIVVEGASGGGKSALLANFLEAYRKCRPRHLVHEHYLGASTDAADPHALVRRLIEFIQRATGSTAEIPGDPQKLMDSLPIWLATASAWASKRRTRFIFVLDSLNSLTDQQDLRWWPAFVPKGVTMLVSCLSGPVMDSLKGKTEALPGHDKPPKWKTLTVRPLTKAQSATLLNTHLAQFNKKLPSKMVKQVQAPLLSTNPLFIRTLAEELRLFGVHEELQKRLDHYLTSQTIDDLFERVLQRIEKDCGKKQVKAAMTAIWASRAGLTEKEILGIADLNPATWAAVRYMLDETLLETSGKIIFAHEYMRLAVKDRYLHTEGLRKSAHRILAQWFSLQPADERRAQEEPWQLHMLGYQKKLHKILLNPAIFLMLWESKPTELLNYWKDHWSRDILLSDYEMNYPEWAKWRDQLKSHRRVWPKLMAALADALWEGGYFGHFPAALQMYARDLTVKNYRARSTIVAKRDINCAYYLRHLADASSLTYARRAVKVLESIGQSEDLVSAYTAMSLCLSSNGQNFEADEYYQLARSALDKSPDTINKIIAKHELISGHFFTSNYARPGEKYAITSLVKEEEIALGREHRLTLESSDLLVGCLLSEECWADACDLAMSLYLRSYRTFGQDHVQTGYAVGKYGIASLHLGDLVSAEWGLSKATEILAQSFPEGHQSRTVFLKPLAETYDQMGKPEESQLIRQCLKSELVGQFFYWGKNLKP